MARKRQPPAHWWDRPGWVLVNEVGLHFDGLFEPDDDHAAAEARADDRTLHLMARDGTTRPAPRTLIGWEFLDTIIGDLCDFDAAGEPNVVVVAKVPRPRGRDRRRS